MTGSGGKKDSCFFQKKSCYFSILSVLCLSSQCVPASNLLPVQDRYNSAYGNPRNAEFPLGVSASHAHFDSC